MILDNNKEVYEQFAQRAVKLFQTDNSVIGIAVGGSWITGELDAFSDLDFIIVTKEPVGHSKERMTVYAEKLGHLLNAFTGEHVGEPRLLICLYGDPLLHVDLKFLTLQEFGIRVETPDILLDKEEQLQGVLQRSQAHYPGPDYQWIEDRYWTWIHYALLKIGRGEYFEALDFISYIRQTVLGPLLHLKNGNLPRGVRKVETQLDPEDLEDLKGTLADYDRRSLLLAIGHAIEIYQLLRAQLFPDISHKHEVEKSVTDYYTEMKKFF